MSSPYELPVGQGIAGRAEQAGQADRRYKCIGGQMDGWVDRWVDRWVDTRNGPNTPATCAPRSAAGLCRRCGAGRALAARARRGRPRAALADAAAADPRHAAAAAAGLSRASQSCLSARASLLVPLCSCLSVVPLCSCLSVSAVPHLLQVVASTFGGGSRMRVGYCVAIMLVCVLDFVMAMLLALFGGWRAPDLLNPDPDHWP